MELKYITFEFDNFDRLTIEGKHVDYMRIDNIRTSFTVYEPGDVSKIETAGFFEAVINKNANTIRYQYDDTSKEELKHYTFERLKCRDITNIKFEISGDDKKYSYAIKWFDDSSFNKYEESFVDKVGNMYILIDEHNIKGKEENTSNC